MTRTLSSLFAATTLAAAAATQCWVPAGGTATTLVTYVPGTPANDEGRSAPRALGFAFPMAGASAASFTHAVIESNGVLYLTNNAPAVNPSFFGGVDWIGAPGDSPRIAPFWSDLEGSATNWSVRTSTAAGVFSVQWINVNEVGYPATKSFRCRLFSNGNIEFSYAAGMGIDSSAGIGVSPANGVADPDGPSDLSTNPVSADSIVYEDAFGQFDLSGSVIRFNASGGGYSVTTLCAPAVNLAYGDSCYELALASFYEDFTATVPTFDLSNSSLSMLPTSTGYLVLSGTSAFVAPSASATVLTLLDDDEAAVALSSPFAFPGGTTSTLMVCSNGYVSAGPGNGVDFADAYEMLNDPVASWRTCFDLNPAAAGSGQVKFEQIGSIAYVTWDGVFEFFTTSPNTMQYQFDTASGAVHIVWQAISAQNNVVVGYSPGGPSSDPGTMDISAALPPTFALVPDVAALALSASPAPVSTVTSGTTVTFTTSSMPALAPGVHVGLHVFSLQATPAPGIDLVILGAPGCFAHVATIGASLPLAGASSTQSIALTVPAGVPAGTTLYSQSIALFPPNSLPGGLNAFGLVSSNGIASVVQPQ